ncbi:MAG: dTDP-4-dehydrorhamnose 3,5-epimerase family protein [Propionivibrio sp.]
MRTGPYKATDYCSPEHERCIRWDDQEVGIAWPLTALPELSGKDRDAVLLRAAQLT